MKQKTLAQFSLTVICTMVLAACGSSGSDSKPATQSTNNTPAATTPAPTTTTAPTTPATTANDTPKVEDKVETPATNTTPVLAGDNDHTVATDALDHGVAAKGTKTVVRNESDFGFLTQPDTDKASLTETMKVQNPDPRFDTLTIAETKTKSGNKDVKAVVYLEHLDVSGDTAKGEAELAGIHVKDAKATAPGVETNTKTAFKGTDSGTALTYHKDRLNYTTNYEGKVATFDAAKKEYAVADAVVGKTDTRDASKTVAELYGNRTHVDLADIKGAKADATANLPLVTTVVDTAKLKNGEKFDTLTEVQYGRVTSSMSEKTLTKLREGLDLKNDELKTYVGTYGEFGAKGTEDHYFYRGVNNTKPEELAALKEAGKVLSYVGHAVTYGLDHTQNGFAGANSKEVPTALSKPQDPNYGFISGTHVQATLNLKDNEVKGSAFNKWYNGTAEKNVDLVTFTGKVSDTGNISGTGTNKFATGAAQDGVFSANLFGKDAQEMGGSVHSNVKDKSAWGLVFGAKRVIEKEPEAPKPKEPGLTNSTNAGN